MKLLFANHQLDALAGSELHTADLCRGFSRAGHEVSVFTLVPGAVSRILEEEGFHVFTQADVRDLEEEDFDLVYLHHSTCEVFIGIMFAGRVPVVRGYVSKGGPASNPTNGSFLSGNLYISEEVRDSIQLHNGRIPSTIARNVYDESQIFSEAFAKIEERDNLPSFAVVSNHLEPQLENLLKEAEREGLCSFTHFGHPNNTVPITAELLMPFDAVITLGRTALFAAAMGKSVYVCDINGSDGWLTPEHFVEVRRQNFSGRRFAITDWNIVQQHLFNLNKWPTVEDLEWVRDKVIRDHALSSRVEQLEGFFLDTIEKHPPPVAIPDGYRGVFNFLWRERNTAWTLRQEKAELSKTSEALAREKEELAMQLQASEKTYEALESSLAEEKQKSQERRKHAHRLAARVQGLEQQIQSIQASRVWKTIHGLGQVKNRLRGK